MEYTLCSAIMSSTSVGLNLAMLAKLSRWLTSTMCTVIQTLLGSVFRRRRIVQINDLVLDRLERLLLELTEIHEHQLVVRLVAEEHLHAFLLHRLHVGRALGQDTTARKASACARAFNAMLFLYVNINTVKSILCHCIWV